MKSKIEIIIGTIFILGGIGFGTVGIISEFASDIYVGIVLIVVGIGILKDRNKTHKNKENK